MLHPKPSELSIKKRERFVFNKAKKFVKEWDYLPTQQINKERIHFFINERNKYLGTDLKFIWTTSPSSLELMLGLSLGSEVGSALRSSLESKLKSSFKSSLEAVHESVLDLSLGSELGSGIWSALGLSLRSSLEESLKSSLEESLRTSLKASIKSSFEELFQSSLESSLKPELESELRPELKSSLDLSLWSSLGSNLESELESSLQGELDSLSWAAIEASLRSSLDASFGSELASSLGSSLESSLQASLGSSLEEFLGPELRSSLESSIESSLQNALSSSVKSFRGFIFRDILYQFNEDENIKNFVKYLPQAYKEGGLGFAMITDREFYALGLPKFYLNDQNRLHRDFGPAVIWEDGSKEYHLNGVRVPEEVVMKKPEEIDPKLLFREQNAAVRREIIRKVEYSRILQKLNAKKLDTYLEYELYRIENIDVEPVNILKVTCPSTGVYYSLRVPPDIQKAREAIHWINKGIDKEEFLEEA